MTLIKYLKFYICFCLLALSYAEEKTKAKPNVKIDVLKESERCIYKTKDKDLIKVHVVSYFEDGQKFDST